MVKRRLLFQVSADILNKYQSSFPSYFVSFDGVDCFELFILPDGYSPVLEGTAPKFQDGFTSSIVLPTTQRKGFNLNIREGLDFKFSVFQDLINAQYAIAGEFSPTICYDFNHPEAIGNGALRRVGKLSDLKPSSGKIRGKFNAYIGITINFYEVQKVFA